ncbi:glutaredoxin family protein [Geomonas sp. RF6]|uniref:glutaredoxin domain-containing protein n=1 Tax=Geomonas sp. RF6 TaxID=2897342 RepID=UPI001E594512|nr:glutaredoxin domain-containing protein [Geomonas sp. RF6]UFS68671.1 glutaredoxin family protein [Geomonas sp. RF6]
MKALTALLVAFLLLIPVYSGAEDGKQSPLKPPAAGQHYPKIVLYSTSWCPHCKAAKEYLTEHNIPFINRDVEMDDEAMQLLTGKYKSKGVPVIVFGDDEIILKGFDQAEFEKALQKCSKK